MLLQVKLNYFTVWLTETSTALRRAQAGGAKVWAFCSLDDILREGVMRMRPAGAMECAFLQSPKARLSTAWAPWAGAVPVSSGGGLGADGLLCSGAGLCLSAAVGFPVLELLASQESPFLPSWIAPAGPTFCTWQSVDAIQDTHPPVLWAASLKCKPVWQMYSSTSLW